MHICMVGYIITLPCTYYTSIIQEETWTLDRYQDETSCVHRHRESNIFYSGYRRIIYVGIIRTYYDNFYFFYFWHYVVVLPQWRVLNFRFDMGNDSLQFDQRHRLRYFILAIYEKILWEYLAQFTIKTTLNDLPKLLGTVFFYTIL